MDKKDGFYAVVNRQRRAGLEVDLLEPDEVVSLLPKLDPDSVAVATYEPRTGFADPYLVAVDYAEGARTSGAEIRTRTPVVGVYLDGRRPTRIETTNGSSQSTA